MTTAIVSWIGAWLPRAGTLLVLAGLAGGAQAQSLLYQGTSAVTAPSSITVSPDSKSVYVAQANIDSVTLFTRDATTGTLTLATTISNDTAGVVGLRKPWRLAISPDQTRVYVACRGSLDQDATGAPLPDTLVVFDRDPSSGALSYRETHTNGQGGVVGIGFPASVIVSADGMHVYVVGMGDDSIALFARNAVSGGLTFVERYRHAASGVTALRQPSSAVLSADGNHVYVTAITSHSIATFARDATSGKLQWAGALEHVATTVDGLDRPLHVVGSGDGKYLYVAGESEDAVGTFSRDITSGALTFAGALQNGANGVTGLDHVTALALSVDGSKLFAVSPTNDALTVLRRDPLTGALSFIETHIDNVTNVEGLNGALDLASSHDGRFVYAVGTENQATVFGALTTDLALSLDSPLGVRLVNQPITFTLAISNPPTAGVADAAMLSATLPASLNVTSATTSHSMCAYLAPALSCTLGQLLPGAKATVQIAALPAQNQSVTVEALAYADQHDTDTANNVVTTPVLVLDTNTAPVANDDDAVTQIDRAVSVDVTKNDIDLDPSDTLAVRSFDAASERGGSVQGNSDGTLTYTPPAEYTGDDYFSYTIEDSQNAVAAALVHVFVNAPPTAVDDEITVLVDQSVSILVTVNDTDPNFSGSAIPDVLTVAAVSASTQSADVTIAPNGVGARVHVVYTPPYNFVGTDTFSYTVVDRHGAEATGRVTVHVSNGLGAQGDGSRFASTNKKRRGSGATDILFLALFPLWALVISRRREPK